MANTGETFTEAVEALCKRNYEEARQIVEEQCRDRDHVTQFVCTEDTREGYIEESFEYRYHREPRAGFSLLFYAVLYDQVDMVKLLIEHGADPFHEDKSGNSALHLACMFSELRTTEALIKGAYEKFEGRLVQEKLLNKANKHECLPLFYAGEKKTKDNIGKVSLLLQNGADLSCYGVKKRNTLLFYSLFSKLDCVEMVLKCDGTATRINDKDEEGNTALHLACKRKNLELVRVLLDYKADPSVLNNQGQTPLNVAICSRAIQCVHLLLDSAALKQASDDQIQEFMQEAIDIDEPKIVLRIMEQRQETYTCIMRGSTQLHDIVRSEAYSEEEFLAAVEHLGMNCIKHEDEHGRTPIMLAAMLNLHQKLKVLQETYSTMLKDNLFHSKEDKFRPHYRDLAGVKRDNEGNSAVHLAVRHNGIDADFEHTIKALDQMREQAVVTESLRTEVRDALILQDRNGLTGMHLALMDGKHERALMLLKVSKCRVAELKDNESSTILHYAIQHKMTVVHFEKLLNELQQESGELLSWICMEQDNSQKTALMLALESRMYRHAELLVNLEQGVDESESFNIRNRQDKNALYVAIENDSPPDLIKKLMKCRVDVDGNVPINESVSLSAIKAVVDYRDETGSEQGSEPRFILSSDQGVGWLMDAIKGGRPDIMKLLLLRGAKVTHSHIKEVVCTHKNEKFALLLVRYAQNPIGLIHQLTIPIESEIDGEDVVSSGGNDKELESVRIQLYVTDTSWADDQLDDSALLFHVMIKTMPDVAEEALYRQATIRREEFEELVTKETLEVMVEQEQLKLLKHPVVLKSLQSKWDEFGRPVYFGQLITYIVLFLVPLSVLVLAPTLLSDIENFDTFPYYFAVWLILGTLYHCLMLALFTFRLNKKGRLKCALVPVLDRLPKYFQMLVYALALIYAALTIASTASDCCESVKDHFGLFTVALSWINLIRLFSQFPIVGEHAIIFGKIVWTFLSLSIFGLFVVFTAIIVLVTTFFNSQALRSPFFSFRRSFVTVLTMVTGELDYQDVFTLSYDANDTSLFSRNLPEQTANFVWVIFVILVPILLTNMLTAMAVGDIIDLKEDAELRRLKQKIGLVTESEDIYNQFGAMKCCRVFANVVGKVYVVAVRKLRRFWSKGGHKMVDDYRVSAYIKQREEDMMLEDTEDTGHVESGRVAIEGSIRDVKNISLSCEKKIAEFKEIVCDDVFTTLKKENAKIRKENEQLMAEVQKLRSNLFSTRKQLTRSHTSYS